MGSVDSEARNPRQALRPLPSVEAPTSYDAHQHRYRESAREGASVLERVWGTARRAVETCDRFAEDVVADADESIFDSLSLYATVSGFRSLK